MTNKLVEGPFNFKTGTTILGLLCNYKIDCTLAASEVHFTLEKGARGWEITGFIRDVVLSKRKQYH